MGKANNSSANQKRECVKLVPLLDSDEFAVSNGKLSFAIGKDTDGNTVLGDLSQMPNLLMAGTTGSGKSVALHCLIISMMLRYSPDQVRFLLIDPKWVEFSCYNGAPHMLTQNTIRDSKAMLNAFVYLTVEAERRRQLFAQAGVDNIDAYNRQIIGKDKSMPHLVCIVDELADLMCYNATAIENFISCLTAQSRATGIHLVLSTQRPDVKVISEKVRNSIPVRIAFTVSAYIDSILILGCGGAESLLGNGDMLYVQPSTTEPIRVQGAYISAIDIRDIVDFACKQFDPCFDEEIAAQIFD